MWLPRAPCLPPFQWGAPGPFSASFLRPLCGPLSVLSGVLWPQRPLTFSPSPHPGHLTLFPAAMEGPPSELRALNCVTARCAALLSPLPLAGHLLPHPQSPQPPNQTPTDPAQSLRSSLFWSLCRCCEAPSVLPGPFPAQCPTQLHPHSPQRTLKAQREAACVLAVCARTGALESWAWISAPSWARSQPLCVPLSS